MMPSIACSGLKGDFHGATRSISGTDAFPPGQPALPVISDNALGDRAGPVQTAGNVDIHRGSSLAGGPSL
jgi:hypothetical protein